MPAPTATLRPQRLWLWAAFSLKPYSSQLLSPGANLWIGFVRLIVGALALVEGVSWAYVGSLAGGNSPELSWLFALALGVIIFVFVWAVDVSLMSLDLDAQHRKHRRHSGVESWRSDGAGQTEASLPDVGSDGWVTALPSAAPDWKDWLRWPVLPVGVRGLLVVMSVVVTAPFITMYVMRAEITHELDKRFQTSLHEVKTSKQKELAAQEKQQLDKLTDLKSQVAVADQRYQDALTVYRLEVAGKGTSGIYGEGAAARASLLVVERLKVELDAQLKELEKFSQNTSVLPAQEEIDAMEKAALNKDFQTLRIRFGIEDVPDSFVARSKVVTEKFKNTEEFMRVEEAVWALLGFLAGALFLLKYFQPDSVLIYFSEARQGQWHEYLNGTYDHLLEPRDQSTRHQAKPLAPLYFRKLWDEVLAPALSDKGLAEARARVLGIETENQEALQEFASLDARLREIDAEIPVKEQELRALQAQRAQMHSDVTWITATREAVVEQAGEEGQQEAIGRLPALRARQDELQAQIRAYDSELAKLEASLRALKNEQQAKLTRKQALERELDAVLAVRKGLDQKQQALAHASIGRIRP